MQTRPSPPETSTGAPASGDRPPADAGTAIHAQARHKVQRTKQRARYERDAIHAVLDAGLIAHVAFCTDAQPGRPQPVVIPMLYARDGDALLLHGSIASRLMNRLGEGVPACVSVTHVDGLVLARSHFHHSVNYRSVVAFGRAVLVEDPARKAAALARFVDVLIPGRAAESRPADRNELAATRVLRFEIEDASAKVREGGVKEDAADLALPHWAGVVPITTGYATPEADPSAAGQALPASVRSLLATGGLRE